MVRLVQRLHLLAGLQTCVALVLFGVAGVAASLEGVHAGEGEAQREVTSSRDVDFEAPRDASDRRLADLIYERLRLPMTSRIPDFALQHDAQGQLALEFHTPSGMTRVTLERERRRLHVEEHRVGLAKYLSNMHGVVGQLRDGSAPRAIRLWSLYTEFSIFALFFLAATGVYQWLATRASARLGQISFAAGTLVCAVAYLWMR